MLLDERNAAKEISHQNERSDPRNAAYNVEQGELGEVHMAGTGNKRRERAEKRHKARNDDGQAAVFCEEMIELGHALGGQGLHLARVDNARSEESGNPVIGRITQNGSRIEDEQCRPHIETAAVGREHARGEQQRIARQKRKEHQARFNEDDQEEGAVDPQRAQCHNPARDGATGVGEKVHEELNNFQDRPFE